MVKIYAVSYWEKLSKEEFSLLYQKTDRKRQEKTDRLKRQTDKERCLLTGALLHYVLGRRGALDGQEFKAGPYGKPYLEQGPEFSLSHAGRWIGLAVGEFPLGLDIEGGRIFRDKVVSKFHKQEQEYYKTVPDTEKTEAFYRLWTGKESYVKRDGRGMGLGFHTFSILSEEIKKDLYFMPLGSDHYLSLCTREPWEKEIHYIKWTDVI